MLSRLPFVLALASVLVAAVLLAGRADADRPTVGRRGDPHSAGARLDPRAVRVAGERGTVPVMVHLAEQADVSGAHALGTKAARGRYVYARLREVADRTQPPLVGWLEARGARVERFFIANMLLVEADAETLTALSGRDEVAFVEHAPEFELLDPMERSDGILRRSETNGPGRSAEAGAGQGVGRGGATTSWAGGPAPASPLAVELGLRQIGADRVWEMGYDGEGFVVAVTDTGVAYKHPALKEQYRGAESGHDYNWLDPVDGEAEPLDEEGHGTHVAGIAVGGTGSRQIGVAPGAQWIGCRVGRTTGVAPGGPTGCLQWALAPTRVDGSDPDPDMAPDVVVASWSSDAPGICHSEWLRQPVANLQAAGVVFVTSSGNGGPDCGSACAPGSYPEAIAVANYDVQARNIHRSSSRGPVPFEDGELIKPDIAAPGMFVNSSVPPSRYEKRSGTSMAAPHVAGAAALLLSARPDLRGEPETVTELLLASGSSIRPDRCGPDDADDFNNSAGHGMLHVDIAVETALAPTPTPEWTATPTASVTPTPTDTPEASPTVPPTATSTEGPETFAVFAPWVGRGAE